MRRPPFDELSLTLNEPTRHRVAWLPPLLDLLDPASSPTQKVVELVDGHRVRPERALLIIRLNTRTRDRLRTIPSLLPVLRLRPHQPRLIVSDQSKQLLTQTPLRVRVDAAGDSGILGSLTNEHTQVPIVQRRRREVTQPATHSQQIIGDRVAMLVDEIDERDQFPRSCTSRCAKKSFWSCLNSPLLMLSTASSVSECSVTGS